MTNPSNLDGIALILRTAYENGRKDERKSMQPITIHPEREPLKKFVGEDGRTYVDTPIITDVEYFERAWPGFCIPLYIMNLEHFLGRHYDPKDYESDNNGYSDYEMLQDVIKFLYKQKKREETYSDVFHEYWKLYEIYKKDIKNDQT